MSHASAIDYHRLPGFRQWNLHSEDDFWVFLGHLFNDLMFLVDWVTKSSNFLPGRIASRHQNLRIFTCFPPVCYWTKLT